MGCGLEHLSNCHGEVTAFLLMCSVGGLWIRTQYQVIKVWTLAKLARWMKRG